jgi:two-component system nitrate/nitrite response regulator NarL
MRALWIEDHLLVGDSLEVLLHVVMPDVSLDKARDLESAKQLVGTFKYELVLLDWWLGEQDGETTIGSLRAAGCVTPIIVVSGDEREAVRRRATALGAVGYVPKTAEPATLVAAIREVLGVSGAAGAGSVHRSDQRTDEAPVRASIDIASAFPGLTPRQIDVFRGLMRGLSDKQIARDLHISDTTVKTHVRAILQTVGVRKRGEATYAARARGAGDD